MPVTLYDASIPVFLRYLGRLENLIAIAESHPAAPTLLAARLAPDMHPFASQVAISASFPLRACLPLAGRAVPPDPELPNSYPGLRARLAQVIQLLMSLQPSEFEGGAQHVVESKAGNALVSLHGAEFLLQYALPNFFFHLTAAYAILRHHGVALGKEDFDGWHAY